MRNVDRFNEAFAHMEHVVMGRRLAKFTLRHRFWLEAMESPLVTGGEAALLDLELAAWVCATPYRQLDRVLPRRLSRGAGRWHRLRYLARVFRRNATEEYQLFQAYLMDHGCPPAVWEEEVIVETAEDGGKPVEGGPLPGVLGLVTGLMRGTGWEPETVWGLSPGEAEWYLAGVFLHRGVDIGLKSAEDEVMIEMLKARKRKRDAEAVTRPGGHAEREDRDRSGIPAEGSGGTEAGVG